MADLIRYLFKLKVRHLFYIALVLSTAVAITLFSFAFLGYYKKQLESRTIEALKIKISLASELIEKALNQRNFSDVEAVIAYLSTLDNVENVFLTDETGRIAFSSHRKLVGKNIKAVIKEVPIENLLKEKFRYIFSKDKSKLYVADSVFLKRENEIRPISHGTLIIKYNFSNELKSAYLALIKADVLFIFSILVAGFILDLMFKRYISRRIESITKALNEVSKGNLNIKASVDGNDEIKSIAEKINDMIDRLKEYVYFDYLTGVFNRFSFERKVEEKIYREEPFALLMFDTDNFKEINDLFGHDVGDRLLQQYAYRLKSVVGENGFVGRFGGDEFLVCLNKCCFENETELKFYANKFLKELDKPFIVDDYKLDITSTVGISLFPDHAREYRELLKIADIALYYGKKLGKNVAVVADKEIVDKSIRKAQLTSYIRRAIENEEFFLVYQPIISARTLKMTGVEALLRWNSEKFGFVSPAEFIPILEETGLIKEVGRWIFHQVAKQAVIWEENGVKDIKINVNVDIQQILEDGFVRFIKNEVLKKNFENIKLGIEITESEAMQYPELIKNILKELRVAGISISIDDFGTGNSSLSYLKLMDIDYIKIDKSFIDGIPDDENSNVLVNTVISLAKAFGYKTVAEGVETHKQVEFLQKAGCDELQGFYFSKPVSPDEIVKIYQSLN